MPQAGTVNITNDDAPNCPATAIGRQLEVVLAEAAELEDEVLVEQKRIGESYARLLRVQLMDRADALRTQLEWVRATSAAGVFYQFVELGILLRDRKNDDGVDRRMARLSAVIFDSLRELSQAGRAMPGYEHGLDLLCEDDFTEVLARHEGVDIRIDKGEPPKAA